ncbi:MAG: sigma 54-interacting transcriptional regulator [Thermodesulfobacteriota bacterium]
MGILDRFAEGMANASPNRAKGFSLRTRLLMYIIPAVVLVLMLTGYINYQTSLNFINEALERSSRIQVKAMAHEIDSLFARCREDLLLVAQVAGDGRGLHENFSRLVATRKTDYHELLFISHKKGHHIFLLAKGNQIFPVSQEAIADITPDPFVTIGYLEKLNAGDVWISPVTEVQEPFPTDNHPDQKIRSHVIYFGTPCYSDNGEKSGYLLLSLDVRFIRNLLSVLNSPRSPLWAFSRTSETRFIYLFDLEGWILFQSEDPEAVDLDLTTHLARMDYSYGTLGKPGLPFAYRPGSIYQPFWKMVKDVEAGKHELIELKAAPHEGQTVRDYYLTYTPVSFEGRVYAGLAYIDRSRFALLAQYKHLDTMLILSLITILVISSVIFVLSHMITKPIYKLAGAVADTQNRPLEPIRIKSSIYEVRMLQQAINAMIEAIKAQIVAIREQEKRIRSVENKEKINLEEAFPAVTQPTSADDLPEIVGFGSRMEQFKASIRKASRADADVLIIGETGTGKQLAAEAIHRHSRRSGRPFISVNCGELSENLLLDTLFGHVKGAFTEARTDRRGAFLEADGGTIFLDEIQTASPNVQQALLRAVAMRTIKQLGSDQDIAMDVRVICATNEDLNRMIEKQQFRADLYYRINVITINTPPLREQKENIPVLINHFLEQVRTSTGRRTLGISKGALEKMKNHDWPGNIRELKNAITRAGVMCEGNTIQAGDILIEGGGYPDADMDISADPETRLTYPSLLSEENIAGNGNGSRSQRAVSIAGFQNGIPLNERQKRVYPYILSRGTITRSEYQAQAGGSISSRTAIYDLQDLVQKGLLKKEGLGPATRYLTPD